MVSTFTDIIHGGIECNWDFVTSYTKFIWCFNTNFSHPQYIYTKYVWDQWVCFNLLLSDTQIYLTVNGKEECLISFLIIRLIKPKLKVTGHVKV